MDWNYLSFDILYLIQDYLWEKDWVHFILTCKNWNRAGNRQKYFKEKVWQNFRKYEENRNSMFSLIKKYRIPNHTTLKQDFLNSHIMISGEWEINRKLLKHVLKSIVNESKEGKIDFYFIMNTSFMHTLFMDTSFMDTSSENIIDKYFERLFPNENLREYVRKRSRCFNCETLESLSNTMEGLFTELEQINQQNNFSVKHYVIFEDATFPFFQKISTDFIRRFYFNGRHANLGFINCVERSTRLDPSSLRNTDISMISKFEQDIRKNININLYYDINYPALNDATQKKFLKKLKNNTYFDKYCKLVLIYDFRDRMQSLTYIDMEDDEITKEKKMTKWRKKSWNLFVNYVHMTDE